MKKLKIFIIAFLVLVILSLSFLTYKLFFKKEQNITIFIHGTFMPEFAILSPYQTYTQNLNDQDFYSKSIEKIRNNKEIYQDSLTLNTGFHKISKKIIQNYTKQKLNKEQSRLGAYHLIGLYNNINESIFKNSNKNIYYTFGFSGLLSNNHRKETSQTLYNCLTNLIKKKSKKNIKLNINLVSFSHGGNVALYLAEVENKYRKNLEINNLVLLGTPIQKETVHFAKSQIFKKIINIYSEADSIQIKDTISTLGQTHRKINDLIKYKKDIYNIRLLADKNKDAFGHSNFWCLGKYGYSHYFWQPTKTKNVLEFLDPLPIVTLIPCFISIIENLRQKLSNKILDLDISLKVKEKKFLIKAYKHNSNKTLYTSQDISNILIKSKDYLSKTWLPYCNNSEIIKTAKAFWLAFKS